MPTDRGNPTRDERDERVTVPEGIDIDPLEFLEGLLAVKPEDEPGDGEE